MSVEAFLHPDMWKWPEFHPTSSFGDVCRPISSFRHVEIARVSPHSIIWRCLWAHIFIQTCGNGQFYPTTLFGDICVPISSSRYVEMARVSPHNIIWRYLLTHFFIQTCKNSQGFTPPHHLDMSNCLWIHSSSRHVEMAIVSTHKIIWRYLWTHFFIQTWGKGPFLHPEMWKWPEFHPTISFEDVYGPISSSRHVKIARFLFQNIIWRNLWTHFFIQTYRNGQSFTL